MASISKREWIYIGGAVGAWLILKPKTPGKPGLLSSLTSKLIPKQTPRPTTTNLATGYGTRTQPSGPSSGIGYNPTSGARSTSLTPTTPVTAGIVAGGNILTSLLNGLFKSQPAAPKPSSSSAPSKPPQGSPSGNVSGPSGGSGAKSGGGPGGYSAGGSIADQPTPDGFYSASGAWVPTDSNGDLLPNPDGTYNGYYDRNPASPSYGDYIEGNVLDSASMYDPSGGGGLQAVVPNLAGSDFSSMHDNSQPALESYTPDVQEDNSNLYDVGTVVPVDEIADGSYVGGDYYGADGSVYYADGSYQDAEGTYVDAAGNYYGADDGATGGGGGGDASDYGPDSGLDGNGE